MALNAAAYLCRLFLVLMRLANDSARTLQEVFDQFAAPEEYTFARTIVPVQAGLRVVTHTA